VSYRNISLSSGSQRETALKLLRSSWNWNSLTWCLQQMGRNMSHRNSLLEKFEMNFMFMEVLFFNFSITMCIALVM